MIALIVCGGAIVTQIPMIKAGTTPVSGEILRKSVNDGNV